MEMSEANFVNLSESLIEVANRVKMEKREANFVNTVDVTSEELSKLQRDIIQENKNGGSLKKNYSDSESDVDSDDELVMKFVKPKKKGGNDFETTAYAFALNNKMSKIRSELARTEERMRYLQLDYNNERVKNDENKSKLDEYKSNIINLKSRYSINILENKKKMNKFAFILIVSLTVNGLFIISKLI